MALSSTKRALIAVAVLVCVVAAGIGIYLYHSSRPLPAPSVSKGPAPTLLDLLPANAPAIAYIDVAALRKLPNSPLTGLLGLTETTTPERHSEGIDRDYAQFVRDTGFDYSRDLNKAAIAFWPHELTPAANDAGANPSLAIADGRFDQQKIVAYALRVGGRSETIGTEKHYIVPGKPDVAFEFLSPTRIAIASGNRAEDLLDMPGATKPASSDPSIQARIQRVAGAPMFGVANTSQLPSDFYASFKNSPQLESIVRSIQSLSLSGQPGGDTIHLALDAECSSMTKAIELSALLDTFRVLGSMSLSDPKTQQQMQLTREQAAFIQALIQQAKLSHQERWVRISLNVTPAMLGEPSHQRRTKRSRRGSSERPH
ncbi:MAG TPA: hypothetical protein VFW94_06320 [Candidatus Acidoferrales bacterium]|nr:hypothetical protein [Candidatus Acidoferrales bacterium]